ncbi:hypothetical protein F4781DRAFT_385655 [Annulohypoxylon bovei var. microspora]|nr:hypothetical protein F4781DRAFT_385655 [Annulohypoxylon bovei var. microspora]
MQFSTFAVIAFFSSVGLATESIHMIDCGTYKAVNYYSNDSNDGSFPGNSNTCVANGGFHEGGSSSCKFGSGVSFSWNLSGGAASAGDATKVGTGNNGFHSFNCFRDDNHVLYTDGNGHACKSTYVCFDS